MLPIHGTEYEEEEEEDGGIAYTKILMAELKTIPPIDRLEWIYRNAHHVNSCRGTLQSCGHCDFPYKKMKASRSSNTGLTWTRERILSRKTKVSEAFEDKIDELHKKVITANEFLSIVDTLNMREYNLDAEYLGFKLAPDTTDIDLLKWHVPGTRLMSNPNTWVLRVIPVLPLVCRPDTEKDGRPMRDDRSIMYRDVMVANTEITNGHGEIGMIKTSRVVKLQNAVGALFASKFRRSAVDQNESVMTMGNPRNLLMNGISDKLKGKSGRFRDNLNGKRGDATGRP
jgi:DNA-directed RNA polymerase beta' subunit